MDEMTSTSTPYWTTPYQNSSPDVTLVFSAIIATVGTVTNILSLSFFIMSIRSRTLTRNKDALTTKLFVLLNVFDLLLSISALLFFTSLEIYDKFPSLQEASYLMFVLSVFVTSFLTCLLTVARTISLVFPFHVVSWVSIKFSMVLYSVIVIALLSIWVYHRHNPSVPTLRTVVYLTRFLIVAGLFTVVLLSNIIAMTSLFLTRFRTQNRKIRRATITVAIIAFIYSICNIGFLVIAAIPLYSQTMYQNIPIEVIDTMIYILLPLNSACNPVVYLTRNSHMRRYLATLRGRVMGFPVKREGDNRYELLDRIDRSITRTLTKTNIL